VQFSQHIDRAVGLFRAWTPLLCRSTSVPFWFVGLGLKWRVHVIYLAATQVASGQVHGVRGSLDSADRYKVLMRFLLQLYNIDISCMLAVALCLRRGQRLRAASSFELNCKMQQQMRRRKAKIKLRHHQQKSKINIIVNDSITWCAFQFNSLMSYKLIAFTRPRGLCCSVKLNHHLMDIFAFLVHRLFPRIRTFW